MKYLNRIMIGLCSSIIKRVKIIFHRNDYVVYEAENPARYLSLHNIESVYKTRPKHCPIGRKFMQNEHRRIIYVSSLRFQIDI